jgi:hypothetical protein
MEKQQCIDSLLAGVVIYGSLDKAMTAVNNKGEKYCYSNNNQDWFRELIHEVKTN